MADNNGNNGNNPIEVLKQMEMYHNMNNNYNNSSGPDMSQIYKEYATDKRANDRWHYDPSAINPALQATTDIPDYEEYTRLGAPYKEGSAYNQTNLWQEQSPWEKATNAAYRFGWNTIYDTVGGIGAMLDPRDYFNTDDQVGNFITEWAAKQKEATAKAAPIYKPEDASIGNFAWWLENGSALASSVAAFGLQGMGVGAVFKGLGAARWLGELAKTGRFGKAAMRGADDIAGIAGKIDDVGASAWDKFWTAGRYKKLEQLAKGTDNLGATLMLNQAESIMTAGELYNSTYQDALDRGYTPEYAKKVAAQAATHSINLNRANMLLNLTSTDMFMKGFGNVSNIKNKINMKSMLKKAGVEGVQEAGEELINLFAEKQGTEYGKKLLEQSDDRNKGVDSINKSKAVTSGYKGLVDSYNSIDWSNPFGDATFKEGFETALLGALGGMGQTALVSGVTQGKGAYAINKAGQMVGIDNLLGLMKTQDAVYKENQYYADGSIKHRKGERIVETEDATYEKDEFDDEGNLLHKKGDVKYITYYDEDNNEQQEAIQKAKLDEKGNPIVLKVGEVDENGNKIEGGKARKFSYNDLYNFRIDEENETLNKVRDQSNKMERLIGGAKIQSQIERTIYGLDNLVNELNTMEDEDKDAIFEDLATLELLQDGETEITQEKVDAKKKEYESLNAKEIRKKQDELMDMSLASQALQAFELGTDNLLLDMFKEVIKMTPEQAKEKGYGDDYKEKAERAITKVKEYQKMYQEFSFKHSPEVARRLFLNRIKRETLGTEAQILNEEIKNLHDKEYEKFKAENSIEKETPETREKYDKAYELEKQRAKKIRDSKELKKLNEEIANLDKELTEINQKIRDEKDENKLKGYRAQLKDITTKLNSNFDKRNKELEKINKPIDEQIKELGLSKESKGVKNQASLHEQRLSHLEKAMKLDAEFDRLRSKKYQEEIKRQAIEKYRKGIENQMFIQVMNALLKQQKETGSVFFRDEYSPEIIKGKIVKEKGKYFFVSDEKVAIVSDETASRFLGKISPQYKKEIEKINDQIDELENQKDNLTEKLDSFIKDELDKVNKEIVKGELSNKELDDLTNYHTNLIEKERERVSSEIQKLNDQIEELENSKNEFSYYTKEDGEVGTEEEGLSIIKSNPVKIRLTFNELENLFTLDKDKLELFEAKNRARELFNEKLARTERAIKRNQRLIDEKKDSNQELLDEQLELQNTLTKYKVFSYLLNKSGDIYSDQEIETEDGGLITVKAGEIIVTDPNGEDSVIKIGDSDFPELTQLSMMQLKMQDQIKSTLENEIKDEVRLLEEIEKESAEIQNRIEVAEKYITGQQQRLVNSKDKLRYLDKESKKIKRLIKQGLPIPNKSKLGIRQRLGIPVGDDAYELLQELERRKSFYETEIINVQRLIESSKSDMEILKTRKAELEEKFPDSRIEEAKERVAVLKQQLNDIGDNSFNFTLLQTISQINSLVTKKNQLESLNKTRSQQLTILEKLLDSYIEKFDLDKNMLKSIFAKRSYNGSIVNTTIQDLLDSDNYTQDQKFEILQLRILMSDVVSNLESTEDLSNDTMVIVKLRSLLENEIIDEDSFDKILKNWTEYQSSFDMYNQILINNLKWDLNSEEKRNEFIDVIFSITERIDELNKEYYDNIQEIDDIAIEVDALSKLNNSTVIVLTPELIKRFNEELLGGTSFTTDQLLNEIESAKDQMAETIVKISDKVKEKEVDLQPVYDEINKLRRTINSLIQIHNDFVDKYTELHEEDKSGNLRMKDVVDEIKDFTSKFSKSSQIKMIQSLEEEIELLQKQLASEQTNIEKYKSILNTFFESLPVPVEIDWSNKDQVSAVLEQYKDSLTLPPAISSSIKTLYNAIAEVEANKKALLDIYNYQNRLLSEITEELNNDVVSDMEEGEDSEITEEEESQKGEEEQKPEITKDAIDDLYKSVSDFIFKPIVNEQDFKNNFKNFVDFFSSKSEIDGEKIVTKGFSFTNQINGVEHTFVNDGIRKSGGKTTLSFVIYKNGIKTGEKLKLEISDINKESDLKKLESMLSQFKSMFEGATFDGKFEEKESDAPTEKTSEKKEDVIINNASDIKIDSSVEDAIDAKYSLFSSQSKIVKWDDKNKTRERDSNGNSIVTKNPHEIRLTNFLNNIVKEEDYRSNYKIKIVKANDPLFEDLSYYDIDGNEIGKYKDAGEKDLLAVIVDEDGNPVIGDDGVIVFSNVVKTARNLTKEQQKIAASNLGIPVENAIAKIKVKNDDGSERTSTPAQEWWNKQIDNFRNDLLDKINNNEEVILSINFISAGGFLNNENASVDNFKALVRDFEITTDDLIIGKNIPLPAPKYIKEGLLYADINGDFIPLIGRNIQNDSDEMTVLLYLFDKWINGNKNQVVSVISEEGVVSELSPFDLINQIIYYDRPNAGEALSNFQMKLDGYKLKYKPFNSKENEITNREISALFENGKLINKSKMTNNQKAFIDFLTSHRRQISKKKLASNNKYNHPIELVINPDNTVSVKMKEYDSYKDYLLSDETFIETDVISDPVINSPVVARYISFGPEDEFFASKKQEEEEEQEETEEEENQEEEKGEETGLNTELKIESFEVKKEESPVQNIKVRNKITNGVKYSLVAVELISEDEIGATIYPIATFHYINGKRVTDKDSIQKVLDNVYVNKDFVSNNNVNFNFIGKEDFVPKVKNVGTKSKPEFIELDISSSINNSKVVPYEFDNLKPHIGDSIHSVISNSIKEEVIEKPKPKVISNENIHKKLPKFSELITKLGFTDSIELGGVSNTEGAKYSPKTKKITLFVDNFDDVDFNNPFVGQNIIHEIIHAKTHNFVDSQNSLPKDKRSEEYNRLMDIHKFAFVSLANAMMDQELTTDLLYDDLSDMESLLYIFFNGGKGSSGKINIIDRILNSNTNEDIDALYNDLMKETKGSSLNEFITFVVSNPDFQKELNAIKLTQEEAEALGSKSSKTLWDLFIDLIGKVFGVSADKDSLLYQALEATADITQNLDRSLSSSKKKVEIKPTKSIGEQKTIIQSNTPFISTVGNVTFGTVSKNDIDNNEDAVYVDVEKGIYMIADGMGNEASPVTTARDMSKMIIDFKLGNNIIDPFKPIIELANSSTTVNEFVEKFEKLVNKKILPSVDENLRILYGIIKANGIANLKGLSASTTFIQAKKVADNKYEIEKVGDTVYFVVDKNGNIKDIHGLSNVRKTEGYDFYFSKGKGVISTPAVDKFTVTLEPGDTLVMSSDFIETDKAIKEFIATDFGKNINFEQFKKSNKVDDSTFISIGYISTQSVQKTKDSDPKTQKLEWKKLKPNRSIYVRSKSNPNEKIELKVFEWASAKIITFDLFRPNGSSFARLMLDEKEFYDKYEVISKEEFLSNEVDEEFDEEFDEEIEELNEESDDFENEIISLINSIITQDEYKNYGGLKSELERRIGIIRDSYNAFDDNINEVNEKILNLLTNKELIDEIVSELEETEEIVIDEKLVVDEKIDDFTDEFGDDVDEDSDFKSPILNRTVIKIAKSPNYNSILQSLKSINNIEELSYNDRLKAIKLITDNLLNSKEKLELYKHIRDQYSELFNKLKENNKTNTEAINEILSDLFSDYLIDNMEEDSILNSYFNKILKFYNNHVVTNNLEKYKEELKLISKSRKNDSLSSPIMNTKINIEGLNLSQTESTAIMDGMTSMMFEYIRRQDADILFDGNIDWKETYDFVRKELLKKINAHGRLLNEEFKTTKLSSRKTELHKDLTRLVEIKNAIFKQSDNDSNWNEIWKRHAMRMRSYGIKFDAENYVIDNSEDGELEATKDRAFSDKGQGEIDEKERIPPAVKLWLASRTRNKESKNVLGFPEMLDFNNNYNYLSDILANTPADIETMYNKLVNEHNKLKAITKDKLLLSDSELERMELFNNILSSDSVLNIKEGSVSQKFNDFKLMTQIFQTFAKQKPKFLISTIKSDGSISYIDSNQNKSADMILRQWSDNYRSNFERTPDGEKMSVNKAKKALTEIRNFLSKMKKSKNSWTEEAKKQDIRKFLNALSSIGIDILNYEQVNNEVLLLGARSLADFINDSIGNSLEKIIEEQEKQNLKYLPIDYNIITDKNHANKIKTLAEIESKLNYTFVNNQSMSADNETLYGITLNHYISLYANEINAIIDSVNASNKKGDYAKNLRKKLLKEKLPHLFNVFNGNSLLLNDIINNGTKIELVLFNGFKPESGDGKKLKDLGEANRWAMLLSSTLTNTPAYTFFRAADRTTETGFRFIDSITGKPKKLVENPNVDVPNKVADYVRDELKAIYALKKLGLGKNIKHYNKNGQNFKYFSDDKLTLNLYQEDSVDLGKQLLKELDDLSAAGVTLENIDKEISKLLTPKMLNDIRTAFVQYNQRKAYGYYYKDNKQRSEIVQSPNAKQAKKDLNNSVKNKLEKLGLLKITPPPVEEVYEKGKYEFKELEKKERNGKYFVGISSDIMLNYFNKYNNGKIDNDSYNEDNIEFILEKILEDFQYLQFMSYVEQGKLLIGDPTMFKNQDDYFKRMSMQNSTKKVTLWGDAINNIFNNNDSGVFYVEYNGKQIELNNVKLSRNQLNNLSENSVKKLVNKYKKELQRQINDISYLKDVTLDDVKLKLNFGYKKNPGWKNHFSTVIFNDVTTTSTLAFVDNVKTISYEDGVINYYNDKGEVITEVSPLTELFTESFIKDGITDSLQLTNKVLSYVDSYRKYDEADGQGYVTLDGYKEILMRAGDWTDAHNNAYSKMLQDIELTPDEITLFPVLKTQYTGPLFNTEGLHVPTGYKHSIFPLIPQVIKGTKLDQMRKFMEENDIAMANMQSANKYGTVLNSSGNVLNFYDKDGNFSWNNKKGKITVNGIEFTSQDTEWKWLGIQVDQAYSFKEKITVGSQFRKLVLSNVMNQGVPVDYNGKKKWSTLSENQKLKQSQLYRLQKEYVDLQSDIIERLFDNLAEELDLEVIYDNKKKITGYKINNRDKLVDIIVESQIDRNLPDNVVVSLNSLKDKDVYIEQILNKEKVEQIIHALINSRIIREKRKGEMSPQIASSMFEADKKQIMLTDGKRLINVDGKTIKEIPSALKTYRKGFDGKTLPAEAMISLPKAWIEWVNDSYGNLDNFNKVIDNLHQKLYAIEEKGEKLTLTPEEENLKNLITVIGFRIPNQGLNSSDFMRIRKFLPTTFGYSVVVPSEMIPKAGSDFDIDKLSMYMPHYKKPSKKKNGEWVLPTYTKYMTKENSTDEERYNAFVDSHKLISELEEESLNEKNRLQELNKQFKDDIKELKTEWLGLNEENYETYKSVLVEIRKNIINNNNKSQQSKLDDLYDLSKQVFRKLPEDFKQQYRQLNKTNEDGTNSIEKLNYRKIITESLIAELKTYDGNSFYTDSNTGFNYKLSNLVSRFEDLLTSYNDILSIYGSDFKVDFDNLDFYKQIKEDQKKNLIDANKETKEKYLSDVSSIEEMIQKNKETVKQIIREAKIKQNNLLSVKEFLKLPINKQNSKDALQNRMIEIHTELISHPLNFRQLMAPISDAVLNDKDNGIVWDIRFLQDTDEITITKDGNNVNVIPAVELLNRKQEIFKNLVFSEEGNIIEENVKGFIDQNGKLNTNKSLISEENINNVILEDGALLNLLGQTAVQYQELRAIWYEAKSKEFKQGSFAQVTDTVTNMKKFIEFLSGKTGGVGQTAVHITHHQLGAAVNLSLNNKEPMWIFNYNKNEEGFPSFANTHGTDGELISETLSAFLNAYVDVAKDPYIFGINAGSQTANMIFMMIRAGAPIKWIGRFLSQPIIKEYIMEQSSNESIPIKSSGLERSKINIVNDITRQYGVITDNSKLNQYKLIYYSNEDIDSKYNDEYTKHVTEDTLNELPTYDDFRRKNATNVIPEIEESWSQIETQLKSGKFDYEKLGEYILYDKLREDGEEIPDVLKYIEEDYNINQVYLLDMFLEYQRQSKHLQELIRVTSADTKGIPQNRRILQENINLSKKVMASGLWNNAEKLIDNTIVNKFQETREKTLGIYKDFYLIEKQALIKQNIDSIYNIFEKYISGSERKAKLYNVILNDFMSALWMIDYNDTTGVFNNTRDVYEKLVVPTVEKSIYKHDDGKPMSLPEFINILMDKKLKKKDAPLSVQKYWPLRKNKFMKRISGYISNEKLSYDKFVSKGSVKIGKPYVNYIRFFNTKGIQEELNAFTEGLQEIKEFKPGQNLSLYRDLLYFAIHQSGFNTTPNSFVKHIPSMEVINANKKRVERFLNLTQEQQEDIIDQFVEQFKHRNLQFNPGIKRFTNNKERKDGTTYKERSIRQKDMSDIGIVVGVKADKDNVFRRFALEGVMPDFDFDFSPNEFTNLMLNYNSTSNIVGEEGYFVGYDIKLKGEEEAKLKSLEKKKIKEEKKEKEKSSVKNHSMNKSMNADENIYNEFTTTLKLAEEGKRTSTTRSKPLGMIGEEITFEKKPQRYVITEVYKVTEEMINDPEWVKQWSQNEGWTTDHFYKVLNDPENTTVKVGSWVTRYQKTGEDFSNLVSELKPTPEFNKLPGKNITPSMIYAGIGSRKTPTHILERMTELAELLEKKGYTLRSGGAEGADTAFEKGVKNKSKTQIFKAEDDRSLEREIKIAHEIHPNLKGVMLSAAKRKATKKQGENSAKFIEKLMARNTNQIFGENLDTPVDFVLAYDPTGWIGKGERPKKGGTLQAIDMAARKGITVINMANPDWEKQLMDLIEGKQTEETEIQEIENAYKLDKGQYHIQPGLDLFKEALTFEEQQEFYKFGKSILERHGYNPFSNYVMASAGQMEWSPEIVIDKNGKEVTRPGNYNKNIISYKKHKSGTDGNTPRWTYHYYTSNFDGTPISKIPANILKILEKVTGQDMSDYDTVLINLYPEGRTLSWHNDISEDYRNMDRDIISVSIGANADFTFANTPDNWLYGSPEGKYDSKKLNLNSGDIVVFGNESRLISHTVTNISGTNNFGQINLSNSNVNKFFKGGLNLNNWRMNFTFRVADPTNNKGKRKIQVIPSTGIKTYKGEIKSLKPNQIFVFGSNLGTSKGGKPTHGKGNAKIAKDKFGAIQGQPRGLQGQSYGIVTKKHWDVPKSSTQEEIKSEIKSLYDYAIQNPDKEFMIAYTGGSNVIGNSGYTNQELADMFSSQPIPSNIVFEEEFSKLLNKPTSSTAKYKYWGAEYTIILDSNNIGIDVEGYRSSKRNKQKLLDNFNQDRNVDPQTKQKVVEKTGPQLINKSNIFSSRKTKLTYTEGQTKALTELGTMIDKSIDGYYLLAGYAGTGKTTLIENIVNYAKAKNKGIVVMAPTNNARKVINKKLKDVDLNEVVEAKTVHKTLYGSPEKDQFGKLTFHELSEIRNSVVIIDEVSLLDKNLLLDIIKSTKEKNNQVIFIGDRFQLEPVGDDPYLFNILDNKDNFAKKYNINIYGATELTEVRRQALDSSILTLATALRTSNEKFIFDSDKNDTKIVRNRQEFSNQFYTSIKNGEDSVMVVATNKERNLVNKSARIAKFGNTNSPVLKDEILVSIANGDNVANGELIKVNAVNSDINEMLLDTYIVKLQKNSFKNEIVYDDTIVVLASIQDDEGMNHPMLLVPSNNIASVYHQTLGEAVVQSNPDLFSRLSNLGYIGQSKSGNYFIMGNVLIATYGYAITAHKSQGGQWSKVFVNENWSNPNWNQARWLYTSITRAADNLIILDNGLKKKSDSEIESIINNSVKSDDSTIETKQEKENRSDDYLPPPMEYGEDAPYSPIVNRIPNRNKAINKAQDIASKWIKDSNCKR